MEKDLCKYADVFYGNGETDRFFEDGLASKWFYIKALCGNTIPHATLPFGKMSVGAYSGGYPTGYGTHFPNSCGGIKKLASMPIAKGFSHLHHSGTGAIRYYYNYAVISPFYGEDICVIHKNEPLTEEVARPGYYKAKLRDAVCELTVDGGVAYHRYTFLKSCGRIAVDFSNMGLDKGFGAHSKEVTAPKIKLLSNSEVVFSGDFFGVRLYFYIKAECDAPSFKIFEQNEILNAESASPDALLYGAVLDFSGSEVRLKVAYSTLCAEEAIRAAEINSVPRDTE